MSRLLSSGASAMLLSSGASAMQTTRSVFGSLITVDDTNTAVRNYLKPDMGNSNYKLFKNCETLKLMNVYIRRRSLLGREREQKGLVNHDQVVVELWMEGAPVSCTIVAEKAASNHDGTAPGGILIHWKPDFVFSIKDDVKYDCFNTPVRLKQVIDVLETPPHNYDLLEANCWQYAAIVVRNLIKGLLDSVNRGGVAFRNLQTVFHAAEAHVTKTNEVIKKNLGVGVVTIGVVAGAIAVAAAIGVAVMNTLGADKEDD